MYAIKFPLPQILTTAPFVPGDPGGPVAPWSPPGPMLPGGPSAPGGPCTQKHNTVIVREASWHTNPASQDQSRQLHAAHTYVRSQLCRHHLQLTHTSAWRSLSPRRPGMTSLPVCPRLAWCTCFSLRALPRRRGRWKRGLSASSLTPTYYCT